MKKFFKRVFYTLVFLIFIGLIAAAAVFGYLYDFEKGKKEEFKDETGELKTQVTTLKAEVEDLKEDAADQILTFEDDGMGVEVEYPSSWKAVLTTDLTEDYLQSEEEDVSGPIAKKYALTLIKNTATLKFETFLGPTGFVPQSVDENTQDYKVLNDDIARVAEKGSETWSYVLVTDCADTPDPDTDAEFCYTSFFSGFSSEHNPNFASVNTSDEALLAEADEIVLSSL